MNSSSATKLKIAVLGPTKSDIQDYIGFLAQVHGGEPVDSAEFGGCTVFRTALSLSPADGDELVNVQVFASSVNSDFRSIFQHFFKGAVGVICLLPAALERADESKRVLGLLQSQLLEPRSKRNIPPFLMQYLWREADMATSPEAIDQILGVNAAVVKRVFSRHNHQDQSLGFSELLPLINSEQAVPVN